MITSLPRRWHVALTPESIEFIGPYYAKKASSCYRTFIGSGWKFYRSHSRSGICIMQGNVHESNFAEHDDSFIVKEKSVLLSLEDFKRLVLQDSSIAFTPATIINVPKI